MADKSPRVLVISSVDPTVGPGVVGVEYYNALKRGGLDVDFMTKFPVEGHPDFISVYDPDRRTGLGLVKKVFRGLKSRLDKQRLNAKPDYFFFYKKETHPPVPVNRVVNKIKRQYDIVCVAFWQELLSFATIEALYDKLHCLFMFLCVDYSVMSGGCHFTGPCDRFQTGCGRCPAFSSCRECDFTRWNVQYRARVYQKVKPVVFGNSYMNSFYRRAYLLKDYDRLEIGYPFMDNEKFKPMDREMYRRRYEIPSDKRFVIFFGSQDLDDERKGFSYLLDALQAFKEHLSPEEERSVLLLIAGRNIDPIKDRLCLDYSYLGFVDPAELPGIYSMSSIFLCSSVNDAGPSMVNQALSCGTPVVSFEMGTALDVVKDRGTGYCATLRDSEDLAKGIEQLFRLSDSDYLSLRKQCRSVALALTSDEAFVKNFMRVYHKYAES